MLMPAAPTPETREISIGAVRLTLHLFTASVGGNAYAAGYADIPPGMGMGEREGLLNDAQAAFARNVGGDADGAERNAIEGFPCRQFSLAGTSSGRPVRLSGRVCATDRRFYQLVFLGPADRESAADVPLFLGSLRLMQ